MVNFKIGIQIDKEIAEFRSKKVKLASLEKDASVRYLNKEPKGYYFNQADTIALIDLYYNSMSEKGTKDSLNQTIMVMNVGKFRTDVSAKQIDIDTKNFKAVPDDFAYPWEAIFQQKSFTEWAKNYELGNLINDTVENLPKYGSIVLKEVGKTVKFVPLQLLINEQTAATLEEAAYVIELHPDMYMYEIEAMAENGWNLEGFKLKFGETIDVYERRGHVPLRWLKEQNGEEPEQGDEDISVDALVYCAKSKDAKSLKEGMHVFFASQIKSRGYFEAHWTKQHGRWLGVGVMEEQFPNQRAKNIVINLIKRSLQWSSKRVLQSANSDVAAKNLATDVKDGEILEVGAQGQISEVNLSAKTNADFTSFLNEWEKNSDQKSFTYEVATGESLPSGTPFRLGVVLSNAVNSYFSLKREKLGLFWTKIINDFMVPQWLADMQNEEKVVAAFSDEPGFNILKEAAMDFVKAEATRISILTGKPVDGDTLVQALDPWQLIKGMFFKRSPQAYKDAPLKFTWTVTGEEVDVEAKLESLKTLYQLLAPAGDPRAEQVLDRIGALTGEYLASFGSGQSKTPALAAPQQANQPKSPIPQPV